MNYARKYIISYLAAGALLLGGCSRIERIAKERDDGINKKWAVSRLIKKNADGVEKGFRIFKKIIYNSFGQ